MESLSPSWNKAIERLNQQLESAGSKKISHALFYDLRSTYLEIYPKNKYVSEKGTLIYDVKVIRFLYFLARIHSFTKNHFATKLLAKRVIEECKPELFSEKFSTFSSIDTLLLQLIQGDI